MPSISIEDPTQLSEAVLAKLTDRDLAELTDRIGTDELIEQNKLQEANAQLDDLDALRERIKAELTKRRER